MQTVSNSNGSVFVAHIELIGEPYILLLKLDPKDALQIDLETLNLKTIENILPDASSRVQKCALIRMNYDPLEENLYVLDKQSDGEPAKFFMETFLQAIPVPNDKKKNNKESGPALVGIELGHREDYTGLLDRMRANGFEYKVVNNDSTLFALLV